MVSNVVSAVIMIAIVVSSLSVMYMYTVNSIASIYSVSSWASERLDIPSMSLHALEPCTSSDSAVPVRIDVARLPGGHVPRRLVVAYENGSVFEYVFAGDSLVFPLSCRDRAMIVVEDERGYPWLYRFEYDAGLSPCSRGFLVNASIVAQGCSISSTGSEGGIALDSVLVSVFGPSLVPVVVAGPSLDNVSGIPRALYEGLKPGVNVEVRVHEPLVEDFNYTSPVFSYYATSDTWVTLDQYTYSFTPYITALNDTLFYRFRAYHARLVYRWPSYIRDDVSMANAPLIDVEASSEVTVNSSVTGYILIPFLVSRDGAPTNIGVFIHPLAYNASYMMHLYKCRITGCTYEGNVTVNASAVAPVQYISVKLYVLDPLDYRYTKIVVEDPTVARELGFPNAVTPLATRVVVPTRLLASPLAVVITIDPSRIFSLVGPGYDYLVVGIAVFFGSTGYSELPHPRDYVDLWWQYAVYFKHIIMLNGVDFLIAVYRDGVSVRLEPNTLYIAPPFVSINGGYVFNANTSLLDQIVLREEKLEVTPWPTNYLVVLVTTLDPVGYETRLLLANATASSLYPVAVTRYYSVGSAGSLSTSVLSVGTASYDLGSYNLTHIPTVIDLVRRGGRSYLLITGG